MLCLLGAASLKLLPSSSSYTTECGLLLISLINEQHCFSFPQISLPEKNNLRQSPDAIKLMAECWAEELLLVLLKLLSLYLYGEGEGI